LIGEIGYCREKHIVFDPSGATVAPCAIHACGKHTLLGMGAVIQILTFAGSIAGDSFSLLFFKAKGQIRGLGIHSMLLFAS
jgi:hypothetical protein